MVIGHKRHKFVAVVAVRPQITGRLWRRLWLWPKMMALASNHHHHAHRTFEGAVFRCPFYVPHAALSREDGAFYVLHAALPQLVPSS